MHKYILPLQYIGQAHNVHDAQTFAYGGALWSTKWAGQSEVQPEQKNFNQNRKS